MKIRRAVAQEAEACWHIRNLSIRDGCKTSYSAEVLIAWTPETMPEDYRKVISEYPFFVAETADARLVATGYLDLSCASVEAIFTLPDYVGKGVTSQILNTLKEEALKRGLKRLILASTPMPRRFMKSMAFCFSTKVRITQRWRSQTCAAWKWPSTSETGVPERLFIAQRERTDFPGLLIACKNETHPDYPRYLLADR